MNRSCGRDPFAAATATARAMIQAHFEFTGETVLAHGTEIADAQKVKGLAPLACKTDKIDAWVLVELSRRDLVPAIWLPTPRCAPSGKGPAGGCTWCVIAPR